MQIKSLSLQNFRNHKSTVLNLSDGINVFVGNNAQGKTNLLEAVYLTCVGRGFRTIRDREMIKFGETVARVCNSSQKKFGNIDIDIAISTVPGRSGKQIKINGIPIAKMGELMGSVTCVFFSPDELRLIKEAPSDRRRFMDIDISQMDKVYFYNLLRYNKILQQRNALLKTIGTSTAEMQGLDIWDEQLAAAGSAIIERRLEFVKQLRSEITTVHKNLTDGKEVIDIKYSGLNVPRGTFAKQISTQGSYGSKVLTVGTFTKPTPTQDSSNSSILTTGTFTKPTPAQGSCDRKALTIGAPAQEPLTQSSHAGMVITTETAAQQTCGKFTKEMLLLELQNARDKDLRLKTTTIGPHRDDLEITVDGKDVRSFASQGQQRTAALSLKLAELRIFENTTGERPLILLDDVFSELDAGRQQRLLEFIKGHQSIITATKFPPQNGITVYKVKDGTIKTN